MARKQAQEQSDHKQTIDMVNSPPHYNKAGIETIDAIMAATDEGFRILFARQHNKICLEIQI